LFGAIAVQKNTRDSQRPVPQVDRSE